MNSICHKLYRYVQETCSNPNGIIYKAIEIVKLVYRLVQPIFRFLKELAFKIPKPSFLKLSLSPAFSNCRLGTNEKHEHIATKNELKNVKVNQTANTQNIGKQENNQIESNIETIIENQVNNQQIEVHIENVFFVAHSSASTPALTNPNATLQYLTKNENKQELVCKPDDQKNDGDGTNLCIEWEVGVFKCKLMAKRNSRASELAETAKKVCAALEKPPTTSHAPALLVERKIEALPPSISIPSN